MADRTPESSSGPETGPGSERCLMALRSAHEKLCVAQTDLEWASHREDIGEALRAIERVGVFVYPSEWSKHREPPIEELR